MRLILIGPDKAGKSTLARNLHEIFGGALIHAKRIPSQPTLVAYVKSTMKMINEGVDFPIDPKGTEYVNPSHPIIFDRFNYPDDLIYEPIVEGRPSPLSDITNEIENNLIANKFIFVYVTANWDCILQRYRDEGDHYVDEEQLIKTYNEYQGFEQRTAVPLVGVNTSYADEASVVHQVIKSLAQIYAKWIALRDVEEV